MLDFANGYQKENQEEVKQIKEECRQKVAGKAAGTEAENSQEIGEKESRFL